MPPSEAGGAPEHGIHPASLQYHWKFIRTSTATDYLMNIYVKGSEQGGELFIQYNINHSVRNPQAR